MVSEYLRPMLDVGSPRVLNCNVITRRILMKEPNAQTFFRCKPLNNLVLIKDTDPQGSGSKNSIGTKIYVPFNENDIYEGGRTIFVHDKGSDKSLIDNFGQGALPKEIFDMDMRVLRILDTLPSLDPFLLKDVFLNEKIEMNPAYFEVGKELWDKIELYILQGFEPLAKAAFPDALSSDEVARKLIETIWEGRDLETLKPLITAFRLPPGKEHEIFAAWKGIMYYGFQQQTAVPQMAALSGWLKEVKIPVGTVSSEERVTLKSTMESSQGHMDREWQAALRILQDYQSGYDKMFVQRAGSGDFVQFLQQCNKHYWTLGNSLGKIGHAAYCWDVMSKRYPNRKMPWEQTREFLTLMDKIFQPEKKAATAANW